MTTAVMPDLEAWMKGEVEKPCDSKLRGLQCLRLASWACHARPSCNKGCGSMTALLCDACHRGFSSGRGTCVRHGVQVTLTWVERIRGAR